MIVKIKLSSGKEIELTKEEFDELMSGKVNIPQLAPIPYIPYIPPFYPIHPWDGTLVVTCKAGE